MNIAKRRDWGNNAESHDEIFQIVAKQILNNLLAIGFDPPITWTRNNYDCTDGMKRKIKARAI